MRRAILTTIIALVGLVGCAEHPTRHDDAGTTIICLSELPQRSARELSTDIELVPLETSDKVLVGAIQQIAVSNRFIYILDWNNNFFVFDRKGRFVHKSRPTGRGPKEFLSVSKFFVDTQSDEIFVYDNARQKLLTFDATGACTGEIRNINDLFAQIHEFAFMNDGKLSGNLIFSPSLSDYYAIMAPDRKFETEKLLLHHPYKWSRISHYGPTPKIATNKDGTRMLGIVSDTVYKVADGGIVPEYVFDSGMRQLTLSELPAELLDFGEVMQYVSRDDKYTRGISNIILTDKTGYSSSYYYKKRLNHIFWSLETGQACIVPQFEAGLSPLESLQFMTATSDSFVGIVYPYDIPSEELARNPQFADLLDIDPDDNPIVVFYKLDNMFDNGR